MIQDFRNVSYILSMIHKERWENGEMSKFLNGYVFTNRQGKEEHFVVLISTLTFNLKIHK